jgi:prolyl-tRNA synthetase
VARRDSGEKMAIPMDNLATTVQKLLWEIQDSIFNKALNYRNENTHEANSWDEFESILNDKGGFVSAHWDGTVETADKIKDKTKATIRCIPLDAKKENGTCILSGKPSEQRVLFAKAY